MGLIFTIWFYFFGCISPKFPATLKDYVRAVDEQHIAGVVLLELDLSAAVDTVD